MPDGRTYYYKSDLWICRVCTKHRREDPEKAKARVRAWYHKNKEYAAAKRRQRYYRGKRRILGDDRDLYGWTATRLRRRLNKIDKSIRLIKIAPTKHERDVIRKLVAMDPRFQFVRGGGINNFGYIKRL